MSQYLGQIWFGKCPKISYTKVSGKMAYAKHVDPDQTALESAQQYENTPI